MGVQRGGQTAIRRLHKFQFGLRLRTACDLDLDGDLIIQRPAVFNIPSLDELEKVLPGLIAKVFGGKNSFTTVTYGG